MSTGPSWNGFTRGNGVLLPCSNSTGCATPGVGGGPRAPVQPAHTPTSGCVPSRVRSCASNVFPQHQQTGRPSCPCSTALLLPGASRLPTPRRWPEVRAFRFRRPAWQGGHEPEGFTSARPRSNASRSKPIRAGTAASGCEATVAEVVHVDAQTVQPKSGPVRVAG